MRLYEIYLNIETSYNGVDAREEANNLVCLSLEACGLKLLKLWIRKIFLFLVIATEKPDLMSIFVCLNFKRRCQHLPLKNAIKYTKKLRTLENKIKK